MNTSKKNDPRYWKKWVQSGAVATHIAFTIKVDRRMIRIHDMDALAGAAFPTTLKDSSRYEEIILALRGFDPPFINNSVWSVSGLDFESNENWNIFSRFLVSK